VERTLHKFGMSLLVPLAITALLGIGFGQAAAQSIVTDPANLIHTTPVSNLDRWINMDGHQTKATLVSLDQLVTDKLRSGQGLTPVELKLESNLLGVADQITIDREPLGVCIFLRGRR